jgi:hypothetical protein
MIRSALASEAPAEILAVADRLEAEDKLEDSLEWRKWYVHLVPGSLEQADRLQDARRRYQLQRVQNWLDHWDSHLEKAELPEEALRELAVLFGYVKRALQARDAEEARAAMNAYMLRFVEHFQRKDTL